MEGYDADHVLAAFPDATELTALALSAGCPMPSLEALPDEPTRVHFAAAYLAGVMTELEGRGVSLAEWCSTIEEASGE